MNLLVITSVFLFAVSNSFGTTYEVTNANTSGAGSLSNALGSATTNGDIINISTTGDVILTLSQPTDVLTISNAITINGPSSGSFTINGGGSYQIFNINGVLGQTTTLNKLRMKNGTDNTGGGIRFYGNGGTLSLEDCEFEGCTATAPSSGLTQGFGGGLYVDNGTANVTACTFYNNTAASLGGGILVAANATLNAVNSTFSENSVTNTASGAWGEGGAISCDGTETVDFCTFYNNTAASSGAGISDYGTSGTARYSIFVSSANTGLETSTGNVTSVTNLQALAYNSPGITRTHALLATSTEAIDQAGTPGTPSTDQRGVTRSGTYDIGAYEFAPSNSNPTLTGLNGASFNENTINTDAAVIDSDVTFNDADGGDLNGGNLTITYSVGGGTEDQLSVIAGGGITLNSTEVQYLGNPIGDITTNGVNGANLVIAFDTANATVTAIDALIQQIGYQNTSNAPNSSRTISITVADGDGGTSTAQTSAITVIAQNDAPEVDTPDDPIVLSAIDEDIGAPSGAVGTLVSSLVDIDGPLFNITEPDGGTTTGIAIEEVDTTNGSWFFSTNGGTNWNAMGTLDFTNVRLLAADANTRFYFQPNENYNGTISFAIMFHAWDRTSGTNGGTADASTTGGPTAFSNNQLFYNITVNPVSDAPILDNTKTPVLGAIDEDAGAPSGAVGTLISSLVDIGGSLSNVTEPDGGTTTGIAITALDTTNGSWYASTNNGASWSALGSFSESDSLLMPADANYRIYFKPNENYNGTISSAISFRAWDQTSGSSGGTADTSGANNGGSTAFSTATDTVNITVNPVSDAPILDNTKTPVLGAIDEDAGAPSGAVGTLISSLVDIGGSLSNVTEPDGGTTTGVAITALDTTNGSWYASTNNGASWSALGSFSESDSLLMPADANYRIYFKPNENYNGTVSSAITFRAWDQTSGSSGGTADTSGANNGGSTAFSTTTDTANITVNPVNDAPVISNLNGDSVAWAGVGNTVSLDSSSNATASDTELDALNGANGDYSGGSLTVQRSGGAVSADVFAFDTSGASFTVSGSNLQSGGQTFATFTNTNGVLTVSFTSSGTAATTALVNNVLQRITYRNDTPAGDATIRFTLSDGSASTNADVTVTSDTIYVTSTTDTASIDPTNGVSFSEAVAIAAADSTGSQTIIFASSLAGQTVSTSSVSNLNESLTINLDSASGVSLTGGTLTLGSISLTVTNGSWDTATISTAIAGTGGLIKTGAGTLTLSGGNSYSNGTTVSAGTLRGSTTGLQGNITNNAAVVFDQGADGTYSNIISGTGWVTKEGLGTVTLSGSNTYSGGTTISVGGLRVTTSSLPGNVTNNGTLEFSQSSDGTYYGTIDGGGSLTKSGSGAVTLSGSNTYTGTTTISAGTLVLSNANALGSTSGGTTVSNGATLEIGASIAIEENITAAGTISITSFGDASIDAAVTLTGDTTIYTKYNSTTVTLFGVLSGNGALTKTGDGQLMLNGDNNGYGGAITVSAGALNVGHDNALGNTTGATTIASGAVLRVNGRTLSENLNVAGTGSGGYGAVSITAGSTSSTLGGAVTLSGDSTIYVESGSNLTIGGAIGGGLGLTKDGSGTLTLSGTNTYTGATNLTNGTLYVTGALNGTSSVTTSSGTTLGGTGSITSYTTTIGGKIAPGVPGTNNGVGAITINGNISFSSLGSLEVDIAGTDIGSTYDAVAVNGSVTITSGASLSVNHSYSPGSGDAYRVISNDGTDAITGTFSGLAEGGTLTAGGNSTELTAYYAATDGGATSGGNEFMLQAPVNQPPAFSNLNGGGTYTENGSAVVIDSDVTVADTELDALNSSAGNYDGASLTVARNGGASSQDVFSNSGLLGTLTEGQSFTYNSTSVGTVTTDSGGTLKLTFNSSATSAIVDAVLQSIAYSNSSDAPPSSVTLDWTFNDGSLNSTGTNQATVSITAVNDAPTLSGGPYSLNSVDEETTTTGVQVSTILDGLTKADADSGASSGIAVTAVSSNGTWQFSTDETTWTDFGTVSESSALLLTSGSYVRYVPDGKNAETATFTFFAWDRTSGTASTNGSPSNGDASTNGGTSAYSSGAASASLTVTAVNDAPTLSGGPYSLTSVNENTTTTGVLVSDILGGVTYADVDSGASSGIAVTAKTGNGTWQFSTDNTNWTSFGTVSGTSSLLIASDAYVRYIPDDKNGETATFTFHAWDQTSGTASTNGSPSNADSSTNGGTTAYSTGTANASLTVTAVNDAPTLSGGPYSFTSVNENTNSASVQVSTILGGVTYADADSGASSGVAVTAVSAKGTWQFSTDETTWTDFGTVSNSSALLLTSGTYVRFVPDGKNAETATFTFRAWDRTSGTASTNDSPSNADSSTNGETSAYSSGTANASLSVTAVNDAPTLSGGPYNMILANEDTTTWGILVSSVLGGVTYADIDSGASSGIAVTAKTGNGTWQYSTDNSNWTDFGTVSESSALLLASDAYIRYAPDGENAETATFTFRAWDQTSGTASTNGSRSTADSSTNGGSTAYSSGTANASQAIAAVNDAPINTVPGTQTTDEDTALVFTSGGNLAIHVFTNISGNAIRISDVDAGSADVQVALTAVNGTLTLSGTTGLAFSSGDGSADAAMTFTGTITNINAALNGLSYSPTANYYGSASVRIQTNDLGNSGSGGELTDDDTVSITIDSVNDAPVANNDTKTTPANTPVNITLTGSDVENDSLTFAIVADPSHGSLSGTPPNVTYTPSNNYIGSDSFTFKANDGSADSNTATVSISVQNRPPVASDDAGETWIEHAIDMDVLPNDSDPDDDSIFIASYTQGSHGTVTPVYGGALLTAPKAKTVSPLNGLGSIEKLTYTPNEGYTGTDSFTYTIGDGNGLYDTATVSISVYSLMTANAGFDRADDIGDTIQLNGSATGGKGAYTFAWKILSGSNTDIAQISDAAANDTTFVPTQTGTYVLELETADGVTPNATDTVQIVMTHRPVADAQNVTTKEDTPIEIALTGSDADGEPLVFAIGAPPSKGTLGALDVQTGAVNYTPNLNSWGSDSFTFTVTDGILVSSPQTVHITVENVDNDPPDTTPITATTNEDSSVWIAMQGNDRDGGVLIYEVLSNPSHGRLSNFQENNKVVLYTPDANYYGEDSFNYRAYDISTGQSSSPAPVSIQVYPVKDAPVANGGSASTGQDVPVGIQLSGSDADPEDSLRFSVTSGPAHGTISDLNVHTGALLYTPNTGFSGDDSFTFAVSDGDSESTATVSIQINAAPTPTATTTNTPVEEPSPTPTDALESTPTSTPVAEQTATSTPLPTDTPQPTATDTPVPENTATPTATDTPVPTATNTPTAEPTSTPTLEPTPTVTNTPVPTPTRYQPIVTDDLTASDDLSGGTDTDYSNSRILAVRWDYQAAGIDVDTVLQTHIYVRENDAPSFTYLGRTDNGNESSFEWKANGRLLAGQYRQGPQFNHSYSFRIYILNKTETPRFFGPFDARGAVELKNAIRITDDVDTEEDLSGGVDVDSADRRRIVVRWKLDPAVMDLTNIKWSHTYVSTDGSKYAYMGTTSNPTDEYFVWEEGGEGVKPDFINGPQFGHTYQFKVYALTLNLTPLFYGPFFANGELTYMGEDGEPTPTSTPVSSTPTPTLAPATPTPTPTVTSTPSAQETPTPTGNSVTVTDSVDTFEDLSNGRDVDAENDRGLVIRWTFSPDDFPLDNLSDVHVYAALNDSDQYVYLGRTASGSATSFQWNAGARLTAPSFRAGPVPGNSYRFRVYALAVDAPRRVYGPIHNAGPVEFATE